MNVLISGNLSCLTNTLAKDFLEGKHQVVLAGRLSAAQVAGLPGITCHSVSPGDEAYQAVIAAYRFQVVIYLATREEHLLRLEPRSAGQVLDGLLDTLEVCQRTGVGQVFYISSTEIAGNDPITPNGHILRTGEQSCRYFREQHGLNITVLRVPFVYGPDEPATLLHDWIRALEERQTALLPAREEQVLGFVHAADVAGYILGAVGDGSTGEQALELAPTDPLTAGGLGRMLAVHYPGARITCAASDAPATRPGDRGSGESTGDWLPRHTLSDSLPALIEAVRQETTPTQTPAQRLKARLKRFRAWLKWGEILLGAAAMVGLNQLSGSLAAFGHVDFRLIYVALVGLRFGVRAGLAGAGLAALSLLYSWVQLNLGWQALVTGLASWVPFALYLSAGALSGYFHDRKEHQIRYHAEQNRAAQARVRALNQRHQEDLQHKNRLSEQLESARDSFERFSRIASELDTLEKEEVLIKALGVLEAVMESRSVAIYLIHPGSSMARLAVHSRPLASLISNSLCLLDQPELAQGIERGVAFENRARLPNLPAYFAPVRDGSTPVAAVVIWNIAAEQYSPDAFSLFKTVCGLVQCTLNRAILFEAANVEKTFLPYTRILKPEPFRRVMQARTRMKNLKIGDYMLATVEDVENGIGQEDHRKLYSLVSAEIRAEDYMGMLEDGRYYVLFTQADGNDARQIFLRLARLGVRCKPVSPPPQPESPVTRPLTPPVRLAAGLRSRPEAQPTGQVEKVH